MTKKGVGGGKGKKEEGEKRLHGRINLGKSASSLP